MQVPTKFDTDNIPMKYRNAYYSLFSLDPGGFKQCNWKSHISYAHWSKILLRQVEQMIET